MHCHLLFNISPLCGVAQTPDCGLLIYFYLSRRRFRHPIGLQLFHWDFGRTTAWLPFYLSCSAILLSECALQICSCASCLHLLYLMSKLSCEYFHSTHLACWFGQMLTKAISWMKSSIASPTPRGVPVSLVRPWIWSLYYIRFRNPNKFIVPHLDARWDASLRVVLSHSPPCYSTITLSSSQ